MNIRQATLEDIDRIKELADQHIDDLGFIVRNAFVTGVKKSFLLIEEETGAFCNYRERQDGVTVIYEIVVPEEHRRKGIGRAFVERLKLPIMLKCLVGAESNEFYASLGFELYETIKREKRDVNIWRKGFMEEWLGRAYK